MQCRLLDQAAESAWWYGAESWDPLSSETEGDLPGHSATRRAADSLCRARWLETSLQPQKVDYWTAAARASALRDPELAAVEVRPGSTRRMKIHIRFSGQRPEFIDRRLIPAHLELFETLFEQRRDIDWDFIPEARQRDRWRAEREQLEAEWHRHFSSLERDSVRWRDSMGTVLRPRWVYFRWEAGRLSTGPESKPLPPQL